MKLIIVCASICILMSCKSKFKAISETESDNLQAKIDNQENLLHPGSGNNQVRKEWRRLNQLCFANDYFKNPNYLGLDNIYGIGSLLDPDNGHIMKDLMKIIPQADYSKFAPVNTPFVPMCSKVKEGELDINVAADAAIRNVTDPDLSFKLKHAKKIKLVTGEWRQLNATVGDLLDYIDTASAPGMDNYRKYKDQKGIYLAVSVLEVSNFSAEFDYDTDIDAGLSGKIQGDSLQPKDVNIPSVHAAVTVKKKGMKSIEVKCNSMFVPLVVLYKKTK